MTDNERYIVKEYNTVVLFLKEQVSKLSKENMKLKADNERLEILFKYASQHGVVLDNNEAIDLIQKLKADKEKLINAYRKLSKEQEKLLNHYFIDTTIGSGTSRQKCIEETVQNYRESLYRELASLGAKDKFNKEFFLTKADKIAKEITNDEH